MSNMAVRGIHGMKLAMTDWLPTRPDDERAYGEQCAPHEGQCGGGCPFERAILFADKTAQLVGTGSYDTRIHLFAAMGGEGETIKIHHDPMIHEFISRIDRCSDNRAANNHPATIADAKAVWAGVCAEYAWSAE